MGVNKKTDGRYIVGMGAPNENEYKGSMGWRDIFIQLTENGATPDSEEKLAFLRDYAIYHNGEGNAIMPPSVSVWVSNNGVTSAVNADDITLEDGTYTICGIKWDGTSWDYTNAGQSSGGGGSSLPSYASSDVGKVLTVGQGTETVVVVPEQTVTTDENGEATLTGVDFSRLTDGDVVSTTIAGLGTRYTEYYSSGTDGEGLYSDGDLYISSTTLFFPRSDTVTISASASVARYITTPFVPEQTVTTDENGEAPLTGVDAFPADFVDGDTAVLTATIDGQIQSGVLSWYDAYRVFSNEDFNITIYYEDSRWYIAITDLTEVEVTLSAVLRKTVPNAVWEKQSGGLPGYSADDNGKKLAIVNGKPEWTFDETPLVTIDTFYIGGTLANPTITYDGRTITPTDLHWALETGIGGSYIAYFVQTIYPYATMFKYGRYVNLGNSGEGFCGIAGDKLIDYKFDLPDESTAYTLTGTSKTITTA